MSACLQSNYSPIMEATSAALGKGVSETVVNLYTKRCKKTQTHAGSEATVYCL